MWEKCLCCDLRFDTHVKMKTHYKEKHSQKFKCRLCPKSFQILEDALHHLMLEHRGMTKEHLSRGVAAEQTKKQLGDFFLSGEAGVNYDCPECFEFFSDIDKLEEHRKKTHNTSLTKDAKKKLKELYDTDLHNPPQCEICNKKYLGLVVCKMNDIPVGACLNCYANYYGPNALTRLTIGTPDVMIQKMKTPIT